LSKKKENIYFDHSSNSQRVKFNNVRRQKCIKKKSSSTFNLDYPPNRLLLMRQVEGSMLVEQHILINMYAVAEPENII
jgi:hypothetical protein